MEKSLQRLSFNALLVFFVGTICLTAWRDDGTLVIPGTDIGTNQPLPEPTDTLYVDQELKSYYFFPQGSWWVYKRIDTNALIYDTAVVATIYNVIEYNEYFPYAWEAAAIGIEHSYYKAPPGFVSPKLSVGMGNQEGYTDRISMNSAGPLFKYLPYFFLFL